MYFLSFFSDMLILLHLYLHYYNSLSLEGVLLNGEHSLIRYTIRL